MRLGNFVKRLFVATSPASPPADHILVPTSSTESAMIKPSSSRPAVAIMNACSGDRPRLCATNAQPATSASSSAAVTRSAMVAARHDRTAARRFLDDPAPAAAGRERQRTAYCAAAAAGAQAASAPRTARVVDPGLGRASKPPAAASLNRKYAAADPSRQTHSVCSGSAPSHAAAMPLARRLASAPASSAADAIDATDVSRASQYAAAAA
mmetsp:Transcript_33537/g.117566  ORF Transcript_33537/g.117566 Transcript_33537/m.117566 type:complete len:210 (-) Transcript_33537:1702-2331(-)